MWIQDFDTRCFCNLSGNEEISVWRILCVTSNCCFVSGILSYHLTPCKLFWVTDAVVRQSSNKYMEWIPNRLLLRWMKTASNVGTYLTYIYITRQTVCVWRNNEACTRNHCCCGKAKSITYFCVCVYARARALGWVRACVYVGVGAQAWACAYTRVALLIQHAPRRHIVICGLSGSTTFFDIIS